VIGRPVEEDIRRTLADRSRQLEQLLRDNGVQTGQRIDSLETGIRRVLELLQLREEDLRAEIRRGEDRAERFGAIATPTREWLDRAADLVTGLRLMRPLLREGRQQVMDGLRDAVAPYSAAWNAWSAGRDATLVDVRRFWPAEEAAATEALFDDIERTHRARILPLNDALRDLQAALIQGGRGRDADRALSAIDGRAADLEGEIEALRTRVQRTLERLRPQ
jgi:hypothetical protein